MSLRNPVPTATKPYFLTRWSSALAVSAAMLLAAGLLFTPAARAQTPAVGGTAPDFTLSTPVGGSVHLRDELHKGQVVLVLLRGFPGYQCPYCTKQVHDFVDHAPQFAAHHTEVLLVYPGPPADLDGHAKEFLAQQQGSLPADITLVTDPNYSMTSAYGLRWDAPHETSYPSTFILDPSGKVLFEKVSHSHGDRTSAQDILDQLAAK